MLLFFNINQLIFVGTGKTSLVRYLINLIKQKTSVAFIPIPNLEPIDFFNYLCEEFGMKNTYQKAVDFLIHFKRFLLTAYSERINVLLIIDEAQNINHRLLEAIRLLSNIELDNRKLTSIFLSVRDLQKRFDHDVAG
ncbi:MAG: ATP-binding protein [Desulfobacterales bacterium]|jgi:type II secretory pathway predicted ATPase ExeA